MIINKTEFAVQGTKFTGALCCLVMKKVETRTTHIIREIIP